MMSSLLEERMMRMAEPGDEESKDILPVEPQKEDEGSDKEQNTNRRFQVINGAQDFTSDKAYVGVMYPMVSMGRLIRLGYLITSDKERINFDPESLAQSGIAADRDPSFHVPRWQIEDIESYLGNAKSVGIAMLFDAILRESKELFDFIDERWHSFLAAWIIGTYFHRMFPSYPYIHLNGNAGSGKTKCLSFIATLAFNGELSVNNTASYMIRVVHNNHATCCIDEVERFGKARDDDSRVVLAMLNAGYKRGSFVGKSEPGNNKKWEPKRFEAYSPKVLAGIQGLHPTLASRCIPIIMLRSSNPNLVNNEVNEEDGKWIIVRNELYRSLLENYKEVSETYKSLTDNTLLGRAWELWKPILAVARCVDEVVYEKLQKLAVEVEVKKKDIETSNIVTPLILKALYEFLEGQKILAGFFPTTKIYTILAAYDAEDFGWLEADDNKSKRGKWLTKELRIAGVIEKNAEQKKINGITTKGYTLDKLLLIELLKRNGIKVEDLEPTTEEPMSSQEIGNNIEF